MSRTKQAALAAALTGAFLILAALNEPEGRMVMAEDTAMQHHLRGLSHVKAGRDDQALAEFERAAAKAEDGSGADKAARAAIVWLREKDQS